MADFIFNPTMPHFNFNFNNRTMPHFNTGHPTMSYFNFNQACITDFATTASNAPQCGVAHKRAPLSLRRPTGAFASRRTFVRSASSSTDALP